jgi:hypothetical protein
MVGIHRLILALGESHLVFRPRHLVCILRGQPSVVGLPGREDLLQQVEPRRGQCRKERGDNGRVRVFPVHMQACRDRIARGQRATSLLALRLVAPPLLVAAAATDHEAKQSKRTKQNRYLVVH